MINLVGYLLWVIHFVEFFFFLIKQQKLIKAGKSLQPPYENAYIKAKRPTN